MTRRLCMECFSDYTDAPSIALCPSCSIEHDLRGLRIRGKYPEADAPGFWGMTAEDIDIEGGDLDFGFHLSTLEGDFPYDPPGHYDYSGVSQ